jgi:hypothetical protein
MSWITLSEDELLARLSSTELDSIQSAGETTPTDRITGILSQVTELVRGKVATCAENLALMGPAGTIPSELQWAAVTIARASLIASLPISNGETDPRQEEFREATRQLDAAARCELKIASEDGSLPGAADGGAGSYGGMPLLDF